MATYYVSQSTANGYAVGSDANACTSKGAPCLTINGGAGKMSSGDTLIVNDGTYSETLLNILPTGTSNVARTIMQAENRRQVLVKPNSGSYVMTISGNNHQYITVDGFVFDGNGIAFNVVKFEGNDIVGNPAYQFPAFIRFQNNTIQNFTTAIQSGLLLAAWLALEGGDNEIFDNVFDNIGNGNSAGLYVTNHRNHIRGNTFTNIHWTAITINKQNAAFPDDNILHNNLFHHNQGQAIIIAGGFRNKLYNNVVHHTTATAAGGNAIHMLSGGDDNEIYHNSFYDIVGSGIAITDSAINDTIVKNNLGFTLTGSIVSNSGTGTVQSNNQEIDPDYVDQANGDLHLEVTSAAIGAGVFLSGVATDFDGLTRPNPPAIGAYEFEEGEEPPDPNPVFYPVGLSPSSRVGRRYV